MMAILGEIYESIQKAKRIIGSCPRLRRESNKKERGAEIGKSDFIISVQVYYEHTLLLISRISFKLQ